MKVCLLAFLLTFCLYNLSSCGLKGKNNYKKLKANRENRSTWNEEMYTNDSISQCLNLNEQFTFHNPHYELIQPFCGVGSYGLSGGDSNELRIETKRVLFNSFYVKRCNQAIQEQVFFKIALVMDSIDTLNFTHFQSEIISRNHPDVLGKGSFKLYGRNLTYEALYFSHGNDIAVVNNRIFHLELGNLLLIHASKSGEVQVKQLHSKVNKLDILIRELNEILAVQANKDFIINGV